MRAGIECLLRLLRDQPQPASTLESEWLDVLALGEQENLLPWLAARLSSFQEQLPLAVSTRVAAIRRQAQQEAFLWSSALKQMLATFHGRGIPVISLKGPWLAERLYGDAALRSYSDLDFLVRPCDWSAAEQLLCELGFSPCGIVDDRHRRWRRGDICIEPHHRLENPLDFDIDAEGLWNRARRSAFRGVPACLLAPSDELMFLSLHAVRHCFERLSLLLDLHFVFRQFPLPDASVYGRRGEELENVLALSWMLAERLDGFSVHSTASAAWLRNRPQLEMIADRIWQRCMLRPAAPTEWRTNHRLYLEMEARTWPRFRRRIRHGRILLTRSVDDDFIFAARFRLRRTWQVWIFRQIRLLIKVARPSQRRAKTISNLPHLLFRQAQTEVTLNGRTES